MIFTILFIVSCFLAYNNGANDNFKGVATLFGSNTTNYKGALLWSTATTFAGSVAAIFVAEALVKNFSGKGLVPDALILNPVFAVSIAIGAGSTVFIATKIGMPISTTHALVGSLMGSGIIAVGSGFKFGKLADSFLIPLIVSPILAALISMLFYFIFRRIRIALGVTKELCVCVGNKSNALPLVTAQNYYRVQELHSTKSINVASAQTCSELYHGRFIGIQAQTLLDFFHYISAGIVSFARGLNDTPKIMGLLIIIQALDLKWGMIAIAFSMSIGGLLNAKKVGEMVAKKITPMNHGQGFTANVVTGLLVTTASLHGMPVSTTHVSVGSIMGMGISGNKSDFKVIRNIALSWLSTLPVSALFSALAYGLLLRLL